MRRASRKFRRRGLILELFDQGFEPTFKFLFVQDVISGVRPSSGAATYAAIGWSNQPEQRPLSAIAAPEDGRTPLNRCFVFAKMRPNKCAVICGTTALAKLLVFRQGSSQINPIVYDGFLNTMTRRARKPGSTRRPAGTSGPATLDRRELWLFRISAVSLPFMLILVLELALRLAGYGYEPANTSAREYLAQVRAMKMHRP